MSRGKFITLEGGEGVGKTTQLAFVREFLEQHGITVLLTREPGGTPLGEQIRSLFLGEESLSAETELLLLFAARDQHLRQRIRPALEAGSWVVCDRYTDASYAYQGGGRGIDHEFIQMLETRIQQGLRPDLTLLLDTQVELGLERAGKRSAADRVEQETRDFFQRVRDAYLQLAQQEPERFRVVDAGLTQRLVEDQIRSHLENYLASL